MTKYTVYAHETVYSSATIEANSVEEAIQKANDDNENYDWEIYDGERFEVERVELKEKK